MRLDHLLSKELLTLRSPEPSSKANVLRWELMGGTFDMTSAQLISASTPFAVGKWGLVSGVSARCWVLRDRISALLGVVDGFLLGLSPVAVVMGVGYRPYFENYTVDASIFETIFGRLG